MRSSVVNRRPSVPRRAVLVKNAALTETGIRSGQDTVAVGFGVGYEQSAYPDWLKQHNRYESYSLAKVVLSVFFALPGASL